MHMATSAQISLNSWVSTPDSFLRTGKSPGCCTKTYNKRKDAYAKDPRQMRGAAILVNTRITGEVLMCRETH